MNNHRCYTNQRVIAEGFVSNGAKVIIQDGLNLHNKPEVRIELHPAMWERWDEQPKSYEQRGSLYFGVNDVGVAHFFAYDEPGRGFGGAKYVLPMNDGTTKELIGPWSSRSAVMNNAGFEHSVEVNIKGKYNMASNMTIKALEKLVNQIGYRMVPYLQFGNEMYYMPVPIDLES